VNKFKTMKNPKKNTIFSYNNTNFLRKCNFPKGKITFFYRNSYVVYEKCVFLMCLIAF